MKQYTKVRVTHLEDTEGWNIHIAHMELRQVGKTGEVYGAVGGRDGIWWVAYGATSFKSGQFVPYLPSELEKIPESAGVENDHA